jgi:inorganic pyrophosphatase
MNPWHDVSTGEQAPHIVNAIIEISRGSKAKYEVDKATGMLKLDRVLYTSFSYPVNYGFIPRTYAGDADPLDILVLCQVDLEPLSIVSAKPIGVLRMQDKGADDKIIAVCSTDASVNHYNSIQELPPHFMQEVKHFFTRYKDLENANVQVADIADAAIAKQIIEEAIEGYTQLVKK